MEQKNIVATIYLKNGQAVRGIEDHTPLADVIELAKLYNDNGIDKIIIFDLSDDDEEHEKNIHTIKNINRNVEIKTCAGGNNATKTEQAERLILDLLADGKELASEDIVKAAAEAGISERTVQNAKRNMGGILGARRVGGQWYNFIKKKQPPEPAS
mgnify:CR=1 FL=1